MKAGSKESSHCPEKCTKSAQRNYFPFKLGLTEFVGEPGVSSQIFVYGVVPEVLKNCDSWNSPARPILNPDTCFWDKHYFSGHQRPE